MCYEQTTLHLLNLFPLGVKPTNYSASSRLLNLKVSLTKPHIMSRTPLSGEVDKKICWRKTVLRVISKVNAP
jgi:hypothetical protein